MPPIIRQATDADAASMADFMNALQTERLDTISRRPTVDAAQEREFIASAGPNGFILIALDGTRVVSVLGVLAGTRPHDCHQGTLGISVSKDWRGKGLGRRMLEAAIAKAKAVPGFCRLELTVVAWNPRAKNLYESVGFVTEGLKRKAVDFRGAPEDEWLMALVW